MEVDRSWNGNTGLGPASWGGLRGWAMLRDPYRSLATRPVCRCPIVALELYPLLRSLPPCPLGTEQRIRCDHASAGIRRLGFLARGPGARLAICVFTRGPFRL